MFNHLHHSQQLFALSSENCFPNKENQFSFLSQKLHKDGLYRTCKAVPAEDCKSQLKTRKRMRRAGGGWLRLWHGVSRSLSPTDWEMETRAQEHEFTNTQPEQTKSLVLRVMATRSTAISKHFSKP